MVNDAECAEAFKIESRYDTFENLHICSFKTFIAKAIAHRNFSKVSTEITNPNGSLWNEIS